MSRGFSLLEVLVATAILIVGVAGLAQSFAIASRANRSARATTVAALLAQQKMEQLHGLAWSIDPYGVPLGDAALSPSPAGALDANTAGYCDFADRGGSVLGAGTTPPSGAIYVRRWSIGPLPANPANTLVLNVSVARLPGSGAAPQPDDVRIATIRTRKAI